MSTDSEVLCYANDGIGQQSDVAYLCILTVSALNSLHAVLGAGLGLGVTGAKLSEACP